MNTIWQPNIHEFHLLCEANSKYQALALLIERVVQSGGLLSEQKLPAQRILADKLKVTHGTVTRAYDLLVKRGIAYAKLGAGTYIKQQAQPLDEFDDTDFASSMMPLMGQQQIIANQMLLLANDQSALDVLLRYKLNGDVSHQQRFKAWLGHKGLQIAKQDLIFCQGAQQGIYTVLDVLTKPGDVVVHESLCYPGFYQACDALGLNPHSVDITDEGIDLAKLEDVCQHNNVKAVYITPNCQNPTNVRYSARVLNDLLALSKRYNFFIIEDDVNYCLPEKWRLPLWQSANDRVFYVASLSKYFAGGLRTGYILAPVLWQQAVLKSVHSQCWSVSMMNFELLARAFEDAEFARNQELLADEIRWRINALKLLLDKYGLNANFFGLNAYLQLPASLPMHSLANQLKAHRVIVRTADVFSRNGAAQHNALRFTLGGPQTRIAFELGLERVEQVLLNLNQELDVVI